MFICIKESFYLESNAKLYGFIGNKSENIEHQF